MPKYQYQVFGEFMFSSIDDKIYKSPKVFDTFEEANQEASNIATYSGGTYRMTVTKLRDGEPIDWYSHAYGEAGPRWYSGKDGGRL